MSESGRFLVIGGGGFLGGHIIRALLDRGDTVHAFDLVKKDIDPRVTFYCGDLTNAKTLGDAIKQVSSCVRSGNKPTYGFCSEWSDMHNTHCLAETRRRNE